MGCAVARPSAHDDDGRQLAPVTSRQLRSCSAPATQLWPPTLSTSTPGRPLLKTVARPYRTYLPWTAMLDGARDTAWVTTSVQQNIRFVFRQRVTKGRDRAGHENTPGEPPRRRKAIVNVVRLRGESTVRFLPKTPLGAPFIAKMTNIR